MSQDQSDQLSAKLNENSKHVTTIDQQRTRYTLGCFIFSTFLKLNTFGLICDGILDTDPSGKFFCHYDII